MYYYYTMSNSCSIIEVKTRKEFKMAIAKYDNCIIDFYGDWCGPCNKLSENLHKIIDEVKNVVIIKVNVNDLDDIASRYSVTVIPHIIFYNKGKLDCKYINTSDYTDIINLANNIFNNSNNSNNSNKKNDEDCV